MSLTSGRKTLTLGFLLAVLAPSLTPVSAAFLPQSNRDFGRGIDGRNVQLGRGLEARDQTFHASTDTSPGTIGVINGTQHIGYLSCNPTETQLTTKINLCSITGVNDPAPTNLQKPSSFTPVSVPGSSGAATFAHNSQGDPQAAQCLTQVNYQFGLQECEVGLVPQVFCFDGRRILLPPEVPVSIPSGFGSAGNPQVDCQTSPPAPDAPAPSGASFLITLGSSQNAS